MKQFKVIFKDREKWPDAIVNADQFNETDNFVCFTSFGDESDAQYGCLRFALETVFSIQEGVS